MTRWKLKGCPRCSGDLNIIHDNLGCYEDCLQCGYHHYYNDQKSRIEQYESGNVKKELELSSVLTGTGNHENIHED
jgi:hypothetical protein